MKKLLTILAILSISINAYSEEAAKDRLFILNDFSGGLASRPSSVGLPPKYDITANNMRLNTSAGEVTKRSVLYAYGQADASEAITSIWRYYQADTDKFLLVTHGDEVEKGNDTTGAFTNILSLTTGDRRWKWLTWHNLAIGGDGYNQPVQYDGNVITYVGTCGAKDNGAGAGPNGTYTYKVSFYSASYEIILDVASAPVTVTDNDIDLSMIPIAPDQILGEATTGRRIYRSTSTGIGPWRLLSNGQIANNTAVSLVDSDADGALGAAYPTGNATWTPPKGKFLLVHDNRLFIAGDPSFPSRLYYSEDGSHDVFKNTSYFDIRNNDGTEITFIENLLGLLTIGKTTTIQKLYTNGDDPAADWEISDPFSSVGCVAPYSAVNTPIGLFYLSFNGIYVFNGQNSVLISDIITPTINDILTTNLNNVAGAFSENLYYLAYASKSSGVAKNTKVLIYDIVGKSFVIDTLNINTFCVLSGGSDGGIIFAGASDSGNVYTYVSASQEIIHENWSDFTGTWSDMRYLPAIVGGVSTSPTLELAWACTIDEWTDHLQAKDHKISQIEHINSYLPNAIIDRPDLNGTYISSVLQTAGASSYDQLKWNEIFTAGVTMDVTFAMRSGPGEHPNATWTTFFGEVSNPSGSDVSGVTAQSYAQYRISMSTEHQASTPYVITEGGYTVKFTYNTVGSVADVSIPFKLETGWLDFDAPIYKKALRKGELWYSSSSFGTVTLRFDEYDGDYQEYTIDLATYPDHYTFYFNDGAFYGSLIKITITMNDLYPITLKRIMIRHDLEPIW
ncbi:MAG: hypothetical protein WC810_02995 [Janthinobacterium sp.]